MDSSQRVAVNSAPLFFQRRKYGGSRIFSNLGHNITSICNHWKLQIYRNGWNRLPEKITAENVAAGTCAIRERRNHSDIWQYDVVTAPDFGGYYLGASISP